MADSSRINHIIRIARIVLDMAVGMALDTGTGIDIVRDSGVDHVS